MFKFCAICFACLNPGEQENIEKFTKRLVKVTKQHNDECKKLLTLMGVPYIEVRSGLTLPQRFMSLIIVLLTDVLPKSFERSSDACLATTSFSPVREINCSRIRAVE